MKRLNKNISSFPEFFYRKTIGESISRSPYSCFATRVMMLLFLLFVFFDSVPTYARSVIADVNPRRIDIDQNFKGVDLLVYGARSDPGNIVVVVRGPQETQIMRKKGRVFGIWTNVENVRLKDLYSYYSVASMKPLSTVQNDELLSKLQVGEDNIYIYGKDKLGLMDQNEIRDSAIKLMQSKGLYSVDNYNITFWGETLFRAFIKFPKNISKGLYSLDVYLFNDGMMKFYQTMPIMVDKVGIESFISDMALKRPLLYGLISVSMALFIGLLVGTLFSKHPK